MSVSIEAGVVVLRGRCAVEDAEQMLQALLDAPDCVVDLSGATRLHTAVVQILLAVKPPINGSLDDPILREFILPGATLR